MPVIIGFPDPGQVYRSEALFPIFRNRTMNASRPEYPEYLRSLAAVGPDDPGTSRTSTTSTRSC